MHSSQTFKCHLPVVILLWKCQIIKQNCNNYKKEDSRIQSDVEELIAKSNQNKFQLNESKCKELRISFAKSAADFASIVINGKAIEVVSTVKLLGLNISSDLRWNCHVAEISKKVASRLYFLKQLKRANIPAKDLLIFYLTCIRPVTEYACPVFHNALPASPAKNVWLVDARPRDIAKLKMAAIPPAFVYSSGKKSYCGLIWVVNAYTDIFRIA